MEDIIVPLGLFAMIGGIVAANVWGGVQGRRALNETAQRAIDVGTPLTPETIWALHKPMRLPEQDLRSGVILVALALGFIAAGLVSTYLGSDVTVLAQDGAHVERGSISIGGDGGGTGFYVIAALVGALGVGNLVSWFIRKPKAV
jgi:hypothetical protein